jgi:hypothetical protein
MEEQYDTIKNANPAAFREQEIIATSAASH